MELGLNFAKDRQGSKSLQTRTQVQVMAPSSRRVGKHLILARVHFLTLFHICPVASFCYSSCSKPSCYNESDADSLSITPARLTRRASATVAKTEQSSSSVPAAQFSETGERIICQCSGRKTSAPFQYLGESLTLRCAPPIFSSQGVSMASSAIARGVG